MKAHEIIDRLARLDEAAPVEEPVVEPETTPAEEPQAPPRRRHSHNPYEMPPDFDPGAMPAPKAEDESGAISAWLEATQQPIQDWEWDGHELRLLMDDGTTEVYRREQLEDIGIFGGEMAFAESEESVEDMLLNDEGGDDEGGDGEDFIGAEPNLEGPGENAAGTLDMILGRTPCSCAGSPENEEPEPLRIEGEKAEELSGAVGNVINIILGIVDGGETSGESPSDKKDESPDKTEDKEDGDDKDKSKGKKEKSKDKDTDKKEDKEDEE